MISRACRGRQGPGSWAFRCGAVPDQVFFPMARRVLGILVPVAVRPGEADDDLVDPAVAVDVVAEVAKAVAVAAVIDRISRGCESRAFSIGVGAAFVPDVARRDVERPSWLTSKAATPSERNVLSRRFAASARRPHARSDHRRRPDRRARRGTVSNTLLLPKVDRRSR